MRDDGDDSLITSNPSNTSCNIFSISSYRECICL